MTAVTLRAGMTLEIPNTKEIAEVVAAERHKAQIEEMEKARGLKYLRRNTLLSTPAGTRVTLLDGITPEPGYVWAVRSISVTLASAGTGQVYITSDSTSTLGVLTQSKPVAAFTTSATCQVELLNSGACLLNVDEGLYLNFTQNIVGYMLQGWAAPAEMAYKLI